MPNPREARLLIASVTSSTRRSAKSAASPMTQPAWLDPTWMARSEHCALTRRSSTSIGIQFLTFGFMAELMMRIYYESQNKKTYLVKEIFTPTRRARVESAYQWVKRTMEEFINRQPHETFSAQEKKQLKARLRKTKLELPPPVSVYADEPDLFTKNDVFYERLANGDMRMRVGGAYLLSAKSWFNLVFTLAHEFAHSIDPCELRAADLSIPAYDRIYACFLQNGLIAARKTRQECGENDQLSETFADWMAVQVVAEALSHFSTEFHGNQLANAATNSVRDLCEQGESPSELNLDLHPSPEIRIDRIFGHNPRIREVLGCGPVTPSARAPASAGLIDSSYEYCGFGFVPKALNIEAEKL